MLIGLFHPLGLLFCDPPWPEIKKCCFFVPLSNASNQTETKDNVCQRRDTVIKISVTTHTRTHTHTHTFNGPLSGTTQVSRYQKGKTNLDFTLIRDSEWQCNQLGHMQVCTLLQTDNHAITHHSVFYRSDALPAAQPTASKHWRLQCESSVTTECKINSSRNASSNTGHKLIKQ